MAKIWRLSVSPRIDGRDGLSAASNMRGCPHPLRANPRKRNVRVSLRQANVEAAEPHSHASGARDERLDLLNHEVDADFVVAAFGNDHVRKSLGGLNKL